MAVSMTNPRSTASIAGHPIHPMLIPFPIAFFVATFVRDLIYWQTASTAWATAGIWLLGAGQPRIRALNDAWWHAGGNIVAVLIELYNWYTRYADGTAAILPKGLILSLVVVCILLFTGWKGWEMVYRYRVGVSDAAESRGSFSEASPRRAA